MKFKNHWITFLLFVFFNSCSTSQNFTHQYTPEQLRGSNTEFRNWWDVQRYDIVIAPNYDKKFIEGSVTISIKILEKSSNFLQLDLQEPMKIDEIIQIENQENEKANEGTLESSEFFREGNVYFLSLKNLPFELVNNQLILKIKFSGNPHIAKYPPWDGGWIFTTDAKNRPWMSAAVQGKGASAWFPNKDYQGDEPDVGATLTMIVPEEMVAIGNGKMWETSFIKGEPGTNVYTWEVKNPINNYNIIPYMGSYVNFSENYKGKKGDLELNYWVLDYNLEKAKEQFKQTKLMLDAFEDWMGAYPFYEDGFKLVESPYLGMEHQSNIAYGNGYMNGYRGSDLSGSGWGKKFDYILIHEAGHEWFGNNITTEDIADMWVHEGFTQYSEVMYVEYHFGKNAANEYAQGLQKNIGNRSPIIGQYGINKEGSGDMYPKGAAMIHTLRQLMEDDVKFKQMIVEMNQDFRHKIVTSNQIEKYISEKKGVDLTQFFDQYLRTTMIPTLEVKKENGKTMFRWTNIVDGFDMPVKLENSEEWIFPTAEWQEYKGNSKIVLDKNFLVKLQE